jgi:hypothetical protein
MPDRTMPGSIRRFVAVGALLVAAGFGLPAAAGAATGSGVVRCTDSTGKVSYTDKECPSSTRRSERLDGIDTNGTSIPMPGPGSSLDGKGGKEDSAIAPPPGQGIAAPRQNPVPPADGGLIVIDPRAGAQQRQQQDQDIVYPYAEYPGAYRRRLPTPQQDLRPTLRNCDAGGCSDTMGNHYDRAGRVDRYTRPDGRTCRPVGTTVVC